MNYYFKNLLETKIKVEDKNAFFNIPINIVELVRFFGMLTHFVTTIWFSLILLFLFFSVRITSLLCKKNYPPITVPQVYGYCRKIGIHLSDFHLDSDMTLELLMRFKEFFLFLSYKKLSVLHYPKAINSAVRMEMTSSTSLKKDWSFIEKWHQTPLKNLGKRLFSHLIQIKRRYNQKNDIFLDSLLIPQEETFSGGSEEENYLKCPLTNQDAINYIGEILKEINKKQDLQFIDLNLTFYLRILFYKVNLIKGKSFNKEKWKKFLLLFYPNYIKSISRAHSLLNRAIITLMPFVFFLDLLYLTLSFYLYGLKSENTKLALMLTLSVLISGILLLAFNFFKGEILNILMNQTDKRGNNTIEEVIPNREKLFMDSKEVKKKINQNLKYIELVSSSNKGRSDRSLLKNIYLNIFLIIKYNKYFFVRSLHASEGKSDPINEIDYVLDIELHTLLTTFNRKEFEDFRGNIIKEIVKNKTTKDRVPDLWLYQ